MSKISALPALADPDGTEQVVAVRNGVTKRVIFSLLVAAAVSPYVADAAAHAAAAAAAAETAAYADNVYASVGEALAAVADHAYFFVPSDATGEFLILYRRNGNAAIEIRRSLSVGVLAQIAAAITDANAAAAAANAAGATVTETAVQAATEYLEDRLSQSINQVISDSILNEIHAPWPFTATAGQTDFVAAGSGAYPSIRVELNKIEIDASDYIRIGDTIRLTTGAYPGTEVDVYPVHLITTLAAEADNVMVNPDAPSRAGTLFSIIRGTVTPDFYGAQAAANPADAIDATNHVQQALNSGKYVELPGYYKLSDGVIGTTPGQVVAGFGRECSGFVMDDDFDLDAQAVVLASSGETGMELRDVGMEFYQPNVTDRAHLIHYPPAFKVVGSPRSRVFRCRISKAWQGINMAGNQGGATIQDVEMSAFDYGIWIDGALDAMRVDNFHYFPFDFVGDPNLTSVFRDGANFAMLVGRCDVLKLNGFMSICRGGAIKFYRGAFPGLEGFAQALITGSDFDAYGGLIIEDGWVSASNCFFSLGGDEGAVASGDDVWIRLKSGHYIGSGNHYLSGGPDVDRLIDICGDADVSRTFTDVGSDWISGDDIPLLETRHTAGSAIVNISNANFGLPANVTLTKPKFKIGGNARITFSGNAATDQGDGTSILLQIDNDEAHVIADNRFTGRGVILPPNYTQLSWRDNIGVRDNAGSGYRMTISDGTSVILPQGTGLLVVADLLGGNDTAAYLIGGSFATLLGSNTAKWVAPTTTPAPGQASITFSDGHYRLYNNTGAGMTAGFDFAKVGAYT